MVKMAASSIFQASPVPRSTRRSSSCLRSVVKCQSSQQDHFPEHLARRSLLAAFGGALILANTKRAEAAFGEGAKIFGGQPTNTTGYVPYKDENFSILLPARWVPTAERDSQGVKLRYEDTYPANNFIVMAGKTDKKSVTDYGAPDQFIKDIANIFGDNSWHGATRSEGGFKQNQVSAASILETDLVTGADGKPHYNAHVLTRSADGNEGGKHQVISATVSGGKLWIMKAQIGDKRWNKGGSRDSKKLQESFAVA